jgi:tRNA A-37 threonylcarbamoyl transferase component Bud32
MGLLFFFHLLGTYLLSPLIMKVLPVYVEIYRKTIKLKRMLFAGKELRYWEKRKDELLEDGHEGYQLKIEELGLVEETLELLKQKTRETIIAKIDQDGYWLSNYGSIKDAPTISQNKFLPRKKTSLYVVLHNGIVGIKKNYRGNKLGFVAELNALYKLGKAGCCVPSIIDINFEELTLTVSYILGKVLREELVKKGARIRDKDTNNQKINEYANIIKGRKVLYDVIDRNFAERIYDEIIKIHRARFIWKDIKYGNIIIDYKTGKPFLIDFEHAQDYEEIREALFRILRDGDIEKFNLHFDYEKPTYKIVRLTVKKKQYPYPAAWYAPIYFGDGLRIGSLWNPDLGYGRWHFLVKHHLPSAKRILDLGANNGFNAIQVLRNGAVEAIGIELNKESIAQGKFVQEIYEWIDNKRYDFKYIHSDMKDIVNKDIGKFDMVMAMCSIYYLKEADIESVIRHISTISDIFVLQANTDRHIKRQNSATFKKASLEYLTRKLKTNGFSDTEVIAPKGYTRPLIIGRKH